MKINLKKLIESMVNERELVEVNVKQLKLKNPNLSDIIDQFARELENKSLMGAIKIYQDKFNKWYKGEEFENKEEEDAAKQDAAEVVLDLARRFERNSKVKKLDAWLKDQGLGAEYKDFAKFYKEYGDKISDAIKSIEKFKTQKKKKKEAKGGAKKLFSDDRLLILEPKTTEASCYYGKETKWCISAKQANMFNEYRGKGIDFIFIIDSQSKYADTEKMAIAYNPNSHFLEIYNAKDKTIAKKNLPIIYGKDWKNVKSILKKMIPNLGIVEFFKGDLVRSKDGEIGEVLDVQKAKDEVFVMWDNKENKPGYYSVDVLELATEEFTEGDIVKLSNRKLSSLGDSDRRFFDGETGKIIDTETVGEQAKRYFIEWNIKGQKHKSWHKSSDITKTN